MLLSFCIPCHARAYDLKRTLPSLIAAANACPPVEIVVLDYNSPDDLEAYMGQIIAETTLTGGGFFTYRCYRGREYFHMAHARNLSVLAASGEYVVEMCADAYPELGYLPAVRAMIAAGCVWMRANELRGILAFRRAEFIAAGGYDERFEFYGPEDKDLDNRLRRRGGQFGLIPSGLMHVIPTPDREKIKNYRLALSKLEMHREMRKIYWENEQNQVLVANSGRGWGQWDG